MTPRAAPPPVTIERVQTGVRLEKRLLKVLKALADYHDITLGDLLEGIVLHAFDGKTPFSEDSLARIQELKRVFGLTLDARDYQAVPTDHRPALVEPGRRHPAGRRRVPHQQHRPGGEAVPREVGVGVHDDLSLVAVGPSHAPHEDEVVSDHP